MFTISSRFRSLRKHPERALNRVLWRCTSSWVILILLILAIFLTFIRAYCFNTPSALLPLNQLERGFVSRKAALSQLKDIIIQLKSPARNKDYNAPTNTVFDNSRFAKQISKDLSIIRAMGLSTLSKQLQVSIGEEFLGEDEETDEDEIITAGAEIFSPSLVSHRFCYNKTFTSQGVHRQVDPAFCSHLIGLLNDIKYGLEPPLLTIFTWLPDPLVDVDKLKRRLLFHNWDLLRPIVQPVLISDSRMNMALANSFDWPCIPVTRYSPQGVPIFKDMASMVANKFNSTFYGYVRSTTVFDASLVETLLKLKENYIDQPGENWNQPRENWNQPGNNWNQPGENWNEPLPHGQEKQGFLQPGRPMLVYGRSLKSAHAGNMDDLEHISEMVTKARNETWANKKDALVYFFYSQTDFHEAPDLIVDDTYLTSLLVSRSMALGHLVVDASLTILAVHVMRKDNTSEWGRQYLSTKSRDLYLNKRLGSEYFHSLGIRKPEKWPNEVGTKFTKTGSMYIDVRSER